MSNIIYFWTGTLWDFKITSYAIVLFVCFILLCIWSSDLTTAIVFPHKLAKCEAALWGCKAAINFIVSKWIWRKEIGSF